MAKQFRPAFVLVVALTLLTGLVYPMIITGISAVAFPYQAGGSLVEREGKVIGSELIGQSFTSDKYFHGRPSATTMPDPNDPSKSVDAPYNAANSGGANQGPTSKALADRLSAQAQKLHDENPAASLSADLLTTSGSGLDPDISPEAADFQIPRIANVRNVSEAQLRELIARQVVGRTFGFLGEPRVNVLKLNLALDQLKS